MQVVRCVEIGFDGVSVWGGHGGMSNRLSEMVNSGGLLWRFVDSAAS